MVFFGYLGEKDALPILCNTLHGLQNIGYDSAGVCVVDAQATCHIRKKTGLIEDLLSYVKQTPASGTWGFAHLRWATHGAPKDANAHPHVSNNGKLVIVHNGVIENQHLLRAQLLEKGYKFSSDTDTEVLVNLIEDVMVASKIPIQEAVPSALQLVSGANGVLVLSLDEPETIIAAQTGSPITLGLGSNEMFISSGSFAFPKEVTNVVQVQSHEFAIVKKSSYEIRTFDQVKIVKEVEDLEVQMQVASKEGYPDFMLKEIMEQPQVLRNCLRGRVSGIRQGHNQLGGLGGDFGGMKILDCLAQASRIVIVASGSSFNAAMLGRYLIESLARVNVQVEFASEFRQATTPLPKLTKPPVVLALSQSGETGDVVACVNYAKSCGLLCLGVVNSPSSTIAKLTHAGVFMRAGPEVGVAATKTFTTQLAVLTMIAILIGRHNGNLSQAAVNQLLDELEKIPDLQEQFLKDNQALFSSIAKTYRYATNFLYLGRGFNFPVALEGAMKLTQMAYIHCEAYPAAEMKHGPIALIDEFMPVLFIAMKDSVYDKVVSNIREVKARKGAVIAITNIDNHDLDESCDFVVRLPHTHDSLLPLLTALPVQLIAYHLGVARKSCVDAPRHQSKYFTNDTSRICSRAASGSIHSQS